MNNIEKLLEYFGGRKQRRSCIFFLVFSIVSLFLVCVLSSCSPPARNLRPAPEPKSADQILKAMKRELNLSLEQKGNIRGIIENQVKKREELIRKYQAQDRQRTTSLGEELKELRISTGNQLQYFLTSEQMIDYGHMQENEDERISGPGMPGGGPQMPQGREGRPGENFPRAN